MRRFPLFILLAVSAAVVFSLSACSVLGGGATPTATSLPPTAAATRTRMPAATSTPLPTATATPVPSLTPTPTATVIAELKDAKFYTSGFLSGYQFFFAVQAKAPIQGHYSAKVGNKDYTCQVNADHTNRLYCTGRLPAVDKKVDYTIYDQTSGQPVKTGTMYIPMF